MNVINVMNVVNVVNGMNVMNGMKLMNVMSVSRPRLLPDRSAHTSSGSASPPKRYGHHVAI